MNKPSHHLRHHRLWLTISLIVLILAIFAFGIHKYLQSQKENDRLTIVITQLRESLQALEGNLSLTEYERDKLGFTLAQTEQKAGELAEETATLNDKVDMFEKLNTLDPELLKKYSKVYFLNEHFAPSGLVEIPQEYVNGEGKIVEVHENVWPYLEDMLEESVDEELGLLASSGYRSFKTQAALKSNYKIIYGAGTANQFSAEQGYSEHQLGTTIDFTTKKTRNLSSSFDTTAEFKWLVEHAHEYGFVLSYPKGNKYYIYEPWHWRFVGVKLATYLHEEKTSLYGMEQRDIDEYLIDIFQ